MASDANISGLDTTKPASVSPTTKSVRDNMVVIKSAVSQLITEVTDLQDAGVGATGPTGPTGPAGADGSDGAGINVIGSLSSIGDLPASASVNDAYLIGGDLYVWDGDEFVNAGQVQGPTGPTGPTGPSGVGATGPTGPTGAAGADGEDANLTLVSHGATASVARPSGYSYVLWVGTVEPTNATDGDVWIDTSA